MFATFLVKVRLKNSINKRNFTVFCRRLVCMTANEKRSFVLNNLTSNKTRASRIATYEIPAKYCKVSFIYRVFKPYFDKKSSKQVSKIILVYVCVVFKAGFFLLLTNYGFISCVYFAKFKELPTLRKLTIYVISIESRVRKYPISTAVLTKSALLVLHNLPIRRLNKTLNPNIRSFTNRDHCK